MIMMHLDFMLVSHSVHIVWLLSVHVLSALQKPKCFQMLALIHSVLVRSRSQPYVFLVFLCAYCKLSECTASCFPVFWLFRFIYFMFKISIDCWTFLIRLRIVHVRIAMRLCFFSSPIYCMYIVLVLVLFVYMKFYQTKFIVSLKPYKNFEPCHKKAFAKADYYKQLYFAISTTMFALLHSYSNFLYLYFLVC